MQGVSCEIVGTLLSHALASLGGGEGKGKLLFLLGEGMRLLHLPSVPLTFHLRSKILLRQFTGLCILVVTDIQCLRQLLSHPRPLPNAHRQKPSSSFPTFSRFGWMTP